MSWQDTFAAVSQSFGAPSATAPKGYTTWNSHLRSLGYGQSFGGSSGVSWNDLASGRLGQPKATTPKPANTPAGFPERINVTYPYSANQQSFGAPAPPPTPPHSTQGDLFGSIGSAVGSLNGPINLANAIPWFMERVHVLARDLAHSNVPVVHELAAGALAPLDVFAAGVTAASHAIAPTMEAFPNYVRDGQLHDRAKVYRGLVSGQTVDWGARGGGLLGTGLGAGPVSNPLNTAAQLIHDIGPLGAIGDVMAGGPLIDLSGTGIKATYTVSAERNQVERYQQMLLHSVDPNQRATAAQRLGILRETLDIPQSVKIALERNPNMSDAQIEEALSKAPEGRAWSYQAGIPGQIQNIATPLLFYLAEARAFGRAGGAAITRGSALGGAGGAAIARGGQVVSATAQLQKYMMAAGLGTTALTTTASAVVRYQGNQAAIDWIDKMNRDSVYSNDPAVQLVTSFSTPVVGAIKTTGRGVKIAGKAVGVAGHFATLPLAKGLGEIPLTAGLGKRMTTFADSETAMLGMLRRMYGPLAESPDFIAQHYDNTGQAFDEVLGVAVEEAATRALPDSERMTINASFAGDPIGRTRYYVNTYAEQAMKLLETDPAAVAARWRVKTMGHHGYAGGGFDAYNAAAAGRDIRGFKAKTYDIRAEMDAVAGYREAFPPEAQAIAHSKLDGMTAADGTIAVQGADSLNSLIQQFPVLRTHWTGLVTTETRVPRASVELVLERATADWQRMTKQNPVRARTGADPILRPNSPTLARDTAEALGTTQETFSAIHEPSPTADQFSMVRQFLVDKTALTAEQAAALPDAEAMLAAQRYVEMTTQPWADLGASVANAEREMATVSAALVKLRAAPKYASQRDQIVAKERKYAALATLIRAASDAVTPFATAVALGKGEARLIGRDIHLTELATRRAEATTRLRELDTINDAGVAMAGDGWHDLFSLVEGQVEYSGGLRPMSGPMRRALNLPHMGDFEAWQTLGNKLNEVEHRLTPAQRRAAHQVLDDGRWKHLSPSETIHAADVSTGLAEGDAVESLARLWTERSGILGGTSEYALRRTAALNLPAEYVALADEMVQTGTTERAVINDPLFQQVTHPGNVARLEDALGSVDTFPAVEELIRQDPVLTERFLAFMQQHGYLRTSNLDEPGIVLSDITPWDAPDVQIGFTFDPFAADATWAPMLREALIPKDFVRPTPGVLVPDGIWDKAILASDKTALEQLAHDLEQTRDSTPTPPTPVPVRVAARVATGARSARPSSRYTRKLAETDGTASPDPAVMDAPGNRIGLDVLSVINHGVTGTRPATINGVVRLLRAIEDGDVRRAGIGPDLAAEAQRVANEILDAAVKEAPKPDTTGIFTKGEFPDDDLALAAQLDHLLKFDDANPLGTLQYGLKKRPQAKVVLEWSKVPGLAEELMSGHFQPYEERVWNTHVREAFNYVFGPVSNAAIRAESKARFLERSGAQGVDGTVATAIHDAWAKLARESHTPRAQRTPTGEYRGAAGDNRLYGDIHNIPNARLEDVAHKAINELYDLTDSKIDAAYLAVLHQGHYADLFRESSSFIRRTLLDRGGKFGDDLARAYGLAAHNPLVTTYYYWFRFGLDVRFHAQNFFEPQILYYGRAGLRKGEISQGYLGATQEWFARLAEDPMTTTGIPLSRDRSAWGYQTFLKEQPDELTAALKGLQAEDPAMMQRALEQMAAHDPQLQDMIRNLDGTADPTKFLGELSDWHTKLMNNASLDGDARIIDEAMAQSLRESPELAQVYAKLREVNLNARDDIRQTFYGNPDRARAERFLNSYLMFWPLSYQLKATKWFARVLFDRAGGLQTNAGGAYLLDQMATTHQRLIATDPQYRDWFEKHKTLVFVAQMLMPLSFDSVGVSLSPFLRDQFFGKTKALWDIGPIYTATHVVVPLAQEAYTDLYPTLKDVPGFDTLYAATTGRKPPKVAPPTAPTALRPLAP